MRASPTSVKHPPVELSMDTKNAGRVRHRHDIRPLEQTEGLLHSRSSPQSNQLSNCPPAWSGGPSDARDRLLRRKTEQRPHIQRLERTHLAIGDVFAVPALTLALQGEEITLRHRNMRELRPQPDKLILRPSERA